MDLRRKLLAGLTLALALGLAVPVRAQAAEGEKSTPAAQSPEKNNQEVDENDAYIHSPMVQKMGKMVGLKSEQAAIAFQVANFVLLAVFVGWVVVKILPKTLRARTQAIQKSLVDARTATEEANARLSSVEDRLSRLDGDIAAMRTQAEQSTAKEAERIRASVEDEKRKILAAAQQEIAAATMHAQKQLQQHAAELAIEQAARKLVVSAETDRLLVQGFAERLAGDESKKGQN